MGGISRVVGQSFEMENYPGRQLTIGGVFGTIPENSHMEFDIIISLVSISRFMGDGTQNWMGNDRYAGYVKVLPGVDPESLAPAIRSMQERHQDMEYMEKYGMKLWYTLHPLTGLHSDQPETRRMALLLSLLAFALILTAMMNYILIVLSSIVSRTKEMAVYKSYGATGKNIMNLMMSETFVHLVVSLVISVFLILLFRGKIQELLGVTVYSLFNLKTLGVLLFICLLVLLFAGITPSLLYARIPVASAFRSYRESRKNWKLVSLFIQFVACTFLACLLVIIWRQYNKMTNDDPGYAYEKLVYASLSGLSEEERGTIVHEVAALADVQAVSTATELLFSGPSGNNVSLPGSDEDLFNIADMYWVDENYLTLMEIPLVEGEGFNPVITGVNQIIVNRKFADKLTMITGWTDGVVGKQVNISEHTDNICVISGVYRDIRIGSLVNEDERPSAFFFRSTPRNNLLMVKLHALNQSGINAVNQTIQRLQPTREIDVNPYKFSMVQLYESSRKFRDSVIIGGIVTLIISLIGLIGYVKDEINRRRSEIAVRKINGATTESILKLFIRDILYIALPSLAIGALAAYVTARKWQEGFSEKTQLSIFIFLFCSVLVLSIILSVVYLNSYRAANDNPVDSLKSE